jgi:hypothetical protein
MRSIGAALGMDQFMHQHFAVVHFILIAFEISDAHIGFEIRGCPEYVSPPAR